MLRITSPQKDPSPWDSGTVLSKLLWGSSHAHQQSFDKEKITVPQTFSESIRQVMARHTGNGDGSDTFVGGCGQKLGRIVSILSTYT